MPTLQFKGKNIIWNHHLSVPYHTLEEVSKLHFQPDKANGNLIIEGDNLLALKALLPMYAGKVKVICIDPPYNIGTEGWVYNDNVNSPLIRDWLGKEVGKDDLTRHDKWLCMMTPRLKLLRDLLANDGVIFITIDDNEISSLRHIMDEIFGEQCFLGTICWKKKTNGNNMGNLPPVHDYIVCYSKVYHEEDILLGFKLDDSYIKRNYSNPDKDPRGDWTTSDLSANHEGPYFPIKNPSTGKIHYPPEGRYWVFNEDEVKKRIADGRIIFGKTGEAAPVQKKFLAERDSLRKKAESWWDNHGLNEDGMSETGELIGKKKFTHPKPVQLIKHIIDITCESGIILDSFSGSGTTGHAVIDLNKQDGANRKFILVQMTEATEREPKKNICKDVTRERIKRAIEKYGYDSGFQYLRVGQPLDAETLLKGKLPDYKSFAKYVYYLCTGENLKEEKKISEKKFFIGTFGKHAIYLIYKQDFEALTRMALNLEMAEKIIADQPDKKRIVYAPACFLDEEYMEANQIEFVSIPYNLFQRKTS